VGSSGRKRERCWPEYASSLTRGSFWKASMPMVAPVTSCTRPASSSVVASPVDFMGMCCSWMPACAASEAEARCEALPLPAEA
jgi:hypothetical protein